MWVKSKEQNHSTLPAESAQEIRRWTSELISNVELGISSLRCCCKKKKGGQAEESEILRPQISMQKKERSYIKDAVPHSSSKLSLRGLEGPSICHVMLLAVEG